LETFGNICIIHPFSSDIHRNRSTTMPMSVQFSFGSIAFVAGAISWIPSLVHAFSQASHFGSIRPALNLRPKASTIPSSYFPARRDATSLITSNIWNSRTDASTGRKSASEKLHPTQKRDLHPPTLHAISQGLLIRAQNISNMPLRFIEDGTMEPWEVTLTAGKIAQRCGEEFQKKTFGDSTLGEKEAEEMQVISGRIVAVLTRLEELEEELLKRCSRGHDIITQKSFGEPGLLFSLGVAENELKAWQTEENSLDAAAAAIDAACLFDEKLRDNRARSLLAMFLYELEGPGLRLNNVVLPCMDVDFLSKDEWDVLFVPNERKEEKTGKISVQDIHGSEASPEVDEEQPNRPLHPIAIDAIEEAFRLRAQNLTTSPLRIINSKTEWFEVQYNAVTFADRFLRKYRSKSLSEEELQTIGGRIVGVLMRLDDLEWEWNHRVCSSPLGQEESASMIPYEQWKTTLGLHPGGVEQVCVETIDVALLEEEDFARARAEKMLGLFLGCIEGPALKASGNRVPGGSEIDFITCTAQRALMEPKLDNPN